MLLAPGDTGFPKTTLLPHKFGDYTFCIEILAFIVPSKASNDASALYLIMLSYLGGKVVGGILCSLIDLPCSINIPLLKLGQSPQSLQYAVHVAAIPQVLQTNVPAAALATIDLFTNT